MYPGSVFVSWVLIFLLWGQFHDPPQKNSWTVFSHANTSINKCTVFKIQQTCQEINTSLSNTSLACFGKIGKLSPSEAQLNRLSFTSPEDSTLFWLLPFPLETLRHDPLRTRPRNPFIRSCRLINNFDRGSQLSCTSSWTVVLGVSMGWLNHVPKCTAVSPWNRVLLSLSLQPPEFKNTSQGVFNQNETDVNYGGFFLTDEMQMAQKAPPLGVCLGNNGLFSVDHSRCDHGSPLVANPFHPLEPEIQPQTFMECERNAAAKTWTCQLSCGHFLLKDWGAAWVMIVPFKKALKGQNWTGNLEEESSSRET